MCESDAKGGSFLRKSSESAPASMPRAKKRVTGEGGDAAGPKKKSKGGGVRGSFPDSGVEKIVSARFVF